MTTTEDIVTSSTCTENMFHTTSVEEIEVNSISFRQSLKFFQEQLITNSRNLSLPTPTHLANNDASSKHGNRYTTSKNACDEANEVKMDEMFNDETRSLNSCKIPIPTVDTILESVRVLRAIQKKQEEQGSIWTLDMTSPSDINYDNNLVDSFCDSLSIVDDNFLCEENVVSQDNASDSRKTETRDYETVLTKEPNGLNSQMKGNDSFEGNSDSVTLLANSSDETCSFWPNHSIIKEKAAKNYDAITKENIENLTCPAESIIQNSTIESQHLKRETEPSLSKHNKSFLNQNEWSEQHEHKTVVNTLEELKVVDQNVTANENDKTNDIIGNDTLRKMHNAEHIHFPQQDDMLNSESLYTENLLKEGILNTKNKEICDELAHKQVITQNQANEITDKNILIDELLGNKSPHDDDQDSGTATERNISCSSPLSEIRLRNDSCSDTCNSLYVSAECSPFLSFTSVEGSPSGLNNMSSTITEYLASEITPQSNDSEWEEPLQFHEENTELEHGKSEATTTSSTADVICETDHFHYNYANGIKNCKASETVDSIHVCTEESCNAQSSTDSQQPETQSASTEHQQELIQPQIYSISNDPNQQGNNLSVNSESQEETSIGYNTDFNITNNVNVSDIGYISNKEHSSDNHDLNIKNGTDDSFTLRMKKITTASYNIISILEQLYTIQEYSTSKVFPETDHFQRKVFVLSKGAFCKYPEGSYILSVEKSLLCIMQESEILLSFTLSYGDVSVINEYILMVDNKLGRCLYLKCDSEQDTMELKEYIKLYCQKCWESDCLSLVHYPLKCNKNVIVIDLGSSSTRAGILMDQPTLPAIFFPTICAKNKETGNCIYGMEALQPEVRQNSILSFPMRPSVKVIKHAIDVDLLGGLFKKIFSDLRIEPNKYTVQICLPRSFSLNTQNALVKLVLEDLNVEAVSLTNQALLTLYAHDVTTAVIVDIGDRMDILPIVDGFIVENGVTRLPHGGQRLIHHMKHALAERHISLSNDIDSYVVQYIIENLSYIAENYADEINMASQHPDVIKKSISLQPFAYDSNTMQWITLDDARFKIPEGLFKPNLWGLDNPGIHQLVQKAIQATSVDVRTKIAENIYISGGVTLLPGFAERLNTEVTKLNKTKVVPKVLASNYRYHCTYIGACKFASMKEFSQVCVNSEENSKHGISALKKFVLYF